jgi:hypothetical protein
LTSSRSLSGGDDANRQGVWPLFQRERLREVLEALGVLFKLGAHRLEPSLRLGLSLLVEIASLAFQLGLSAFPLPGQREQERDECPEEAGDQPRPEALAAVALDDENDRDQQPDRKQRGEGLRRRRARHPRHRGDSSACDQPTSGQTISTRSKPSGSIAGRGSKAAALPAPAPFLGRPGHAAGDLLNELVA